MDLEHWRSYFRPDQALDIEYRAAELGVSAPKLAQQYLNLAKVQARSNSATASVWHDCSQCGAGFMDLLERRTQRRGVSGLLARLILRPRFIWKCQACGYETDAG